MSRPRPPAPPSVFGRVLGALGVRRGRGGPPPVSAPPPPDADVLRKLRAAIAATSWTTPDAAPAGPTPWDRPLQRPTAPPPVTPRAPAPRATEQASVHVEETAGHVEGTAWQSEQVAGRMEDTFGHVEDAPTASPEASPPPGLAPTSAVWASPRRPTDARWEASPTAAAWRSS